MRLIVNGETRELAGAGTFAQALELLDMADARVATALNGEFVPAAARAQTGLKEGDVLEILSPMQGG